MYHFQNLTKRYHLSPIFSKFEKLGIPKNLTSSVSIVNLHICHKKKKRRRRKKKKKKKGGEWMKTKRNGERKGEGGVVNTLPLPLITRSRINPKAEIKIKSRSEINVGTA